MLTDEWLSRGIMSTRKPCLWFSETVTQKYVTRKGTLSIKSYRTTIINEEQMARHWSVFKLRRQCDKENIRGYESCKEETTPCHLCI